MCSNLSGVIKRRAKEVRECGQDVDKHVSSTDDDKTSTKTGSETGKCDTESNIKVHSLAVMLLVEFVESLEKAMFNASDGCAVAVSPPNKVQIFFHLSESFSCVCIYLFCTYLFIHYVPSFNIQLSHFSFNFLILFTLYFCTS